ncbi:hypothetical protein PV326_003671 [Microctonus aethiopoides]|nr:hypothetical protein PV326_003671 [Microctonus aethiopoides]
MSCSQQLTTLDWSEISRSVSHLITLGIQTSERVCLAAYSSQWTEWSKRNKMILVIIMMRAAKEYKYTAYGMISLSLKQVTTMRRSRCLCCFFFVLLITLVVYNILKAVIHSSTHGIREHHLLHPYRSNRRDPIIIEYQKVQDRWKRSDGRYTGVKTILYWNTMYVERHRDFMFGKGDVFKNCKVPHCYATSYRYLLDSVINYDAILFHGIEMPLFNLPRSRSPNQRYIYFSWESPLSRPLNSHDFASWPNFYNWTMSYRLDSDIIRPYGVIRDIITQEIVFPPKNENDIIQWRNPNTTFYKPSDEVLSIIRDKGQVAAWFVSHCKTLSYREYLVDILRKYFEVDIYGACGEYKCNRKNKQECYEIVEKDYFFYLSFENTLCKDYITEKVFYPMSKYVIPVVYGGANYSKILPPHSYINVDDFESAAELADYMIDLISKPYDYASYFWWKEYYQIEDSNEYTLCDLCEKLHDSTMPKKSLKNFRNYYQKDQCYELEFKFNSSTTHLP